MKKTEIYLSPTGGTQKVLDIIANQWKGPKDIIDLSSNDELLSKQIQSDDLCFVAVPSFGGRVPDIAIQKIKQLNGHHAKTILICVYGNRAYDDTLLELYQTLQECQFDCIGAIGAIAQHSIMSQYGKDRPNINDEQELIQFTKQIKQKLLLSTYEDLKVPGQFPYKEYGGVPFHPTANKNCNQCGLCAQKCPVQAIDIHNLQGVIKDKCISCMRCVSLCPQHARSINPLALKVASQKLKKACSTYKNNELFL